LILVPVFKTLIYLPRFIGILLAECALKSIGKVRDLAGFLSNTLKNYFYWYCTWAALGCQKKLRCTLAA